MRRWLYRALRLGELAHFFSWLVGLGLLGALLSAVAGVSLLPWYSKLGIAGFGLIALIGGIGLLAPRLRPIVNVDLAPTGGPSPSLRLTVTNRGQPGQLNARAAITATREDPNAIRTGTFQLKWLNESAPDRSLATGHQADLLIAKLQEPPQQQPGEHWYVMAVQQLAGGTEAQWQTFTWLASPTERMPECDLEISIHASYARQPLVRRFTVRPAGPWRPLEMLSIT